MTRTRHVTRYGFTLVELLVAMAVIVTLAAISVIVVPDVIKQDRTTDAAGSVRQWLSLAKARAARDQQPRGVRFLVGTDQNNPAKSNPLWVTELQFTEAKTILTLDASRAQFRNVYATFFSAFDAAGGTVVSPPPWSTNSSPQCVISNLTFDDAQQIVAGSLLTVSNIGTGSSHRVLYVPPNLPQASGPPLPNPTPTPMLTNLPPNGAFPMPGSFSVTLILDSYPQSDLGAAGVANQTTPIPVFTTNLFGVTAPPQPLVGEPTLQLPANICVDLSASMSGSSTLNSIPTPPYIDIVFLPSGQVQPTFTSTVNASGSQVIQSIGASSQIFLWVRDYTKTPVALNVIGPGPTFDMTPFNMGGEQQIVSIKTKSGSLGTFPVLWPQSNGVYAANQDPYMFARLGATSP